MGFFKDLNEMKKTGKQMEKEKFGTTNPFKIMKQGVGQASDMLHQVQADQEKTQRLMADSLHGQATIKAMRDTGKAGQHDAGVGVRPRSSPWTVATRTWSLTSRSCLTPCCGRLRARHHGARAGGHERPDLVDHRLNGRTMGRGRCTYRPRPATPQPSAVSRRSAAGHA